MERVVPFVPLRLNRVCLSQSGVSPLRLGGPPARRLSPDHAAHSPATLFHFSVYCASLGGIRGGRSGVNDGSLPACGVAADPAPGEGSPPDISMTTLGVMNSLTASIRPPSPLPKSAARPPCGRPAAISRAALSVFSASESLYGMR